jgi:putative FmdB family regulatory protein
MPTYAYQCESCGAEIEVIQKMSDAPLTKCQSCGGKLQKKMFPVGIVFKGSGFYVNDYAKKGGASSSTLSPTNASTESAPAASSSDMKTPAKTESTPAQAKGESKIPAAASSAAKS